MTAGSRITRENYVTCWRSHVYKRHAAPLFSSGQLVHEFSVALRPQKPRGLLGTATSTFTQLLRAGHFSSLQFTSVQCRFTSTETIRTIRDGEPRTATSTFTQLLSSLWSTKRWTEDRIEPRNVPFPQTEQKRETMSSEPPLHGLSDCDDFPRAAGQFDS